MEDLERLPFFVPRMYKERHPPAPPRDPSFVRPYGESLKISITAINNAILIPLDGGTHPVSRRILKQILNE